MNPTAIADRRKNYLGSWMNNTFIRFLTFDFNSVGGSDQALPHDDDDDDTNASSSNSTIKRKFGRDIVWKPEYHYEDDQLEPYRFIGDPELDHLLKSCNDYNGHFDDTILECSKVYNQWKKSKTTGSHVDKLPEQEQIMKDFYQHYYERIPSWVDFDQIQRGIDVFLSFSIVAGLSLYYLSLVPGFSIPKIALVLQQTQYLSPPSSKEKIQERLMDTGGFIASVMKSSSPHNEEQMKDDSRKKTGVEPSSFLSASSLRPGGEGWTAALQVRTLHAKVRRMLLRRSILPTKSKMKVAVKKESDDQNKSKHHQQQQGWDIHNFGVPINQEDLAATLLAFSVNVLSGIEFIAGRPLSQKQQLDYLALWRYLGWLLGVHSEEDFSHHEECRINGDGTPTNNTMHAFSKLVPLDPCGPRQSPSTNSKNQSTRRKSNTDPKKILVHARASLESIICHLMHPDNSSVMISHHLLKAGRSRPSSNSDTSSRQSENGSKTNSSVDSFNDRSNDDDSSISHTSESFHFLFRCCMCRYFIGDPLADALKLPSWKNGRMGVSSIWKSYLAFLLSTTLLMVLRIHTLMVMAFPLYHVYFFEWHKNSVLKFHTFWKKRHDERMAKAARLSLKLREKDAPGRKVNESSKLDSSHQSSIDSHTSSQSTHPRRSSCPFALVMPPIVPNKSKIS